MWALSTLWHKSFWWLMLINPRYPRLSHNWLALNVRPSFHQCLSSPWSTWRVFPALCWHGITWQVPKSTGAVGDAVYGQDSQPTASGFDACALSKRVSTFIHAPGGGIVSTASTCWSKSSTCRESVYSSLSASESSAAWRRSAFLLCRLQVFPCWQMDVPPGQI